MRRIRGSRLFRRSVNSKYAAALFAALAALLLFGAFWRGINACLRPAVETMALSRAVNQMTRMMNTAVSDCVLNYELEYSDFISLKMDDMGQIISMTSDLASVSLLKSCVAEYVAGELENLREENFSIPLGTLTGWIIFSGKGPSIRVEVLSVGDVEVQMRHEFSSTGINQTLHQIYLDVSAAMHLMIPGEVLSETAETTVCVAETVIVGEVPETYFYVGNGDADHG